MENMFINAIKNESSFNGAKTYTENGAVARKTTGSQVLDLYGVIGSMRERSSAEIQDKVLRAWAEDPLTTLKIIFYARNIRGGLGERDTAKTALKWVANAHPETMVKNFENVLKFGRGDDLYAFVGTKVESQMWIFMEQIIVHDLKNMNEKKPISLMAKWMKSVNTSSKESRELGRKTARALHLTEKHYRKMLSCMREYLKVVERNMSANEWDKVAYPSVPAYAMKRYRRAFAKHDYSRFDEFINRVEKGEVSIKATTLYPYDLTKNYISYFSSQKKPLDRVVEAQWKALPNYVEGENNILVMADISGSMYCAEERPIATSVGLAIYFAERNNGPFKNTYMAFATSPRYLTIPSGASLRDNVQTVLSQGMGYSTNLEGAFNKVLETCVLNHLPQSQIPKAIVVISDMEINRFYGGNGLDFVSEMQRRFAMHEYEMPKLILWNVESRQDVFHASRENPAVQFASGSSASTFKAILETLGMNAYEAMQKVLSNPIYNSVVL